MASQTGHALPAAYDALNIGIALYDPDSGAILDGNERLAEIFGYSVSELRERSISEYTANTFVHSVADFRSRLQDSAAGGSRQFTWRIKRADGELIWARIHLSERVVSGRTYVCAEIRDITEYFETHHREELLWRILRHNLRNEATVIAGNTARITASAGTEAVRDASKTIRSRVENLTNIVESVKQIERAVARPGTDYTRCHVTRRVRGVVNTILTDYPTSEITVTERAELWVDSNDAFTYALTHAIENAIIHSEAVTPSVEVSVGPSPNTGRVEICIRDSNPPIPDTEISALFDPTQATETAHGTGVGLFVMKWCIESLGGELRFERSGDGNAVFFYLPARDPPDDQQ
ncbi:MULTISPECIES: PAS domain-containing sensor histidine kinase [Haloarcula]|jgi:PAS domain S-box-containing protein|uniref:histidine kinase n=1 Tax=Haloarcula marismortui (strain ATCC 43049 / DSM 3752 / JCM 8966 / VKM B-1809) TaxID=272569 RepID=Q5UXG6_HALMA|nr:MULTISPECIES: PAS domain-containing sensor histidine kinase [Haloarcula]AAV48037.1 signal-transducing histidine kinase-like [Haloarcula marismortui ATCC 43049]KZX48965.1 histidine kinase [Haloarcula sp. K1]QCP92707.1 PAS domain-containing sensor histidine kinase [Haloarcula marismortui ATCC 43049]